MIHINRNRMDIFVKILGGIVTSMFIVALVLSAIDGSMIVTRVNLIITAINTILINLYAWFDELDEWWSKRKGK